MIRLCLAALSVGVTGASLFVDADTFRRRGHGGEPATHSVAKAALEVPARLPDSINGIWVVLPSCNSCNADALTYEDLRRVGDQVPLSIVCPGDPREWPPKIRELANSKVFSDAEVPWMPGSWYVLAPLVLEFRSGRLLDSSLARESTAKQYLETLK